MSPIVVIVVVTIVLVLVIFALSGVRVVQQYERGVIFILGRLTGAKGPGLFWVPPIITHMVKVDLRIVTLTVPPQDVITRDNVTIKVAAVVYYYVVDPIAAVVNVVNFGQATTQIGQTTLRNVLGQSELDELLAQRTKVNRELQAIIDEHTERWGVKVTAVEIKDIDLPSWDAACYGEASRGRAREAGQGHSRRGRITGFGLHWHRLRMSLVPSPALSNCATSRH